MRQLPLVLLLAAAACQHPPSPAPSSPPPSPPAPSPPPPPVDASVDVPTGVEDAGATSADVPLRVLAAARPCEVIVEPAGDAGTPNDCVELERVRPEGEALRVCFGAAATLRFRYDAAGRIVESPTASYRHQRDGSAVRTRGANRATVAFDAEGRLVREGAVRIRYTADGRIARREGAARYVEFVYAPDGTYTTRHNYPDRDEFCLADLVEVRVDARGRAVFDRYDHCAINEIERTLRTTYGADDRVERVEVDLESNGSVEGTVRLRYPDAEGRCPAP